MIKAKHHIVIYPMFKLLTRCFLKRRFNSVQIQGNFQDNGNAVLVLANHISWWDGFWMMYLNLKIIKRKFHFMMLENQLRKNWYFQYSGGYSIKKQSRSIIDSLEYTNNLLHKRKNMVFIFPQGKIHSMHQHKIDFEHGISRIIERCQPEVQILFSANFVDYFSNPKPNLFMHLETHSVEEFLNQEIESSYNSFYNRALSTHKTKVS
jgi:1-acyl-sn-glycerol-3-phosphate acyltransferase